MNNETGGKAPCGNFNEPYDDLKKKLRKTRNMGFRHFSLVGTDVHTSLKQLTQEFGFQKAAAKILLKLGFKLFGSIVPALIDSRLIANDIDCMGNIDIFCQFVLLMEHQFRVVFLLDNPTINQHKCRGRECQRGGRGRGCHESKQDRRKNDGYGCVYKCAFIIDGDIVLKIDFITTFNGMQSPLTHEFSLTNYYGKHGSLPKYGGYNMRMTPEQMIANIRMKRVTPIKPNKIMTKEEFNSENDNQLKRISKYVSKGLVLGDSVLEYFIHYHNRTERKQVNILLEDCVPTVLAEIIDSYMKRPLDYDYCGLCNGKLITTSNYPYFMVLPIHDGFENTTYCGSCVDNRLDEIKINMDGVRKIITANNDFEEITDNDESE